MKCATADCLKRDRPIRRSRGKGKAGRRRSSRSLTRPAVCPTVGGSVALHRTHSAGFAASTCVQCTSTVWWCDSVVAAAAAACVRAVYGRSCLESQ